MTTVYAWPTSRAFMVENCSIFLQPNTREFTSQYTGGFQATDLFGERFHMTIHLPVCVRADGSLRSGFLNRLRGVGWISAYNFGRPVPVGTQRGASLALSSAVAQAASALPISGGSNGLTYEPGDMLGVGNELFEVAEEVVFNGSGLATVQTTNRVRTLGGLAVGTPVLWNQPTANWRVVSPAAVMYLPGQVCDGLDLELVQVWS